MMQLENASLFFDGYATNLRIEVNGVPVLLGCGAGEYHEAFMRAGVVFLPREEARKGLPVLELALDQGERPRKVKGITDDPRLFALYAGLVKWCAGDPDAPAWLLDEPIPIPEK